MTLTRIVGRKNLDLLRYQGEQEIDVSADRVRARFATPGKHTIYDRKLREAEKYLEAVAGNKPPANLRKFPYLAAETGISAPTTELLAQLWVTMNEQWETISPAIEQITLGANPQVRNAPRKAEIDAIVEVTVATLDGIGDKPPKAPKRPRTNT